MGKPLRCCNCNKVIAEHVSIQQGVVKITCKCGTVNEVKAEQRQNVPYGERVNMHTKDGKEFTFQIPYNQLNTEGDVFVPGCFDKSIGKK